MTDKINNKNTPWPKWAAIAVGSDINSLYDAALDAWESGEDANEWREARHPLLTLSTLQETVAGLLPGCDFEYDNFGQLLIYTGKMVNDEGLLIPLVFDEREEDVKHGALVDKDQ